MEKLIESEIKAIREDVPKISDLADEYLFSLLAYKYFYNEGYLDFKTYKQIFTDGKKDGGIDLLFQLEDSNEQVHLVFIQSKKISSLANTQDVIDIFTKIDQTFRNFEKNITVSYNERLKRIFKENLSDIEEQSPIYDITVFLGVTLSTKRKKEIADKIEEIESLKRYECVVYDLEDISKQIHAIKEPKKYVSEGKISFALKDGKITYGENGLLVNISANSLKALYDKYKDDGLFEQNFRYFIRNKKIDDSIKNSLSKKKQEFWFLNNGIIIGCSEFEPDGNKIVLYNFSIINGCQTTTLIGEYSGENEGEDFFLPCKIVKSEKNKIDDKFFNFISSIAESSNSQKPIGERDLKANRIELRNLKQLLINDEPKVLLVNKRGEEIKKRSTYEPWQIVNNDLFGQIVLAFNLQRPGTARSGKKKIFADEDVYSKIFKRNHDAVNIKQVLKLYHYYSEFLNNRGAAFLYPSQESVASNGKLYILAVLGLFIKIKRKLLDFAYIANPDTWELELEKDNIVGRIFADYDGDDFDQLLYGLFTEIIQEIAEAFEKRSTEKKTVTNYFKLDIDYRNDILKHFISRYYQNPKRRAELDEYMKLFI